MPRLFRHLAIVGLLLVASAQATPWTAPETPDVDQVLQEARAAAGAGNLERAAAMHRWYHENALRHAPAHAGVRLSFALADWHELALRHPPALRDMEAARDRAAARVREGGPQRREAMQDLAALDMQPSDPRTTAGAMAWLDANRPADAREFAALALAATVAQGEYGLALRHLDVEALLRSSESFLKSMDDIALRRKQAAHPMERQATVRHLDRQAAPALVALVKTGQAQAAQQLFDRLQAILGAEAPMAHGRDALRGFAPPFRRY